MTASTFGAAYDKLPQEMQIAIRQQLRIRRHRYELALRRGYSGLTRVVLLGDTPGPARPTLPNFHHTPFYSTKNSSLWLNKQLIEAGIDENSLLWFNTTLADGKPLEAVHIEDLKHVKLCIICLGGNAEMWMRRNAPTSEYVKVYHPQYAKRFHAKEPYALIGLLKEILQLRNSG